MEERFTLGNQREDGHQQATRTTSSPMDNVQVRRDEDDAQVRAEVPMHLFK